MIIIANADGTLSSVKPSSVYQGSNLANEIVFIGEFASNCTVTIAYTLPNGTTLDESYLTYRESIKCDGEDRYSVWNGKVKGKVTEKAGIVTAQIYIYPPSYNENGTIVNPIIAIKSFEFTINKGVPVEYNATTLLPIQEVKNYISSRIYEFNDELNGKLSLKVNKNDIDTKLNKNSDNPIANSVVATKLEELENKAPDLTVINKEIAEIKTKTDILNVDKNQPNKFLSEDGKYKEIKECECVPIVVDKELNENSTNVVENQAIAKAIKGKQDKLTAGENIKIENGVISAEGGSGGTNVEANPTEEASEDLSKLKVGETVYDLVDKTELAKKLNAPKLPTIRSVVCINPDGTVDRRGLGSIPSEAGNGCVPMYYTSNTSNAIPTARLITGTPLYDGEAANKKFVIDAIANAGGGGAKLYKHTFVYDIGFGEHSGIFISTASTKIIQGTPQIDDMLTMTQDNSVTIISPIYYLDGDNSFIYNEGIGYIMSLPETLVSFDEVVTEV